MNSLKYNFFLITLLSIFLFMNNSNSQNSTSDKNTKAAKQKSELILPDSNANKIILDNGLTIITKVDKSAPVASVQVWCKTGSIYENELIGSGISHLVEHMVFKGSKKLKTGEFAKEVQNIGGYTNAYTSYDRTVYYISCPKEGVKKSIDLLSDLVNNPTFPKKEYEKERNVVRREIDMGEDDPGRSIFKLTVSNVFQKHPYKYPVIGIRDIYNALTYEEMVDYHKKHYIPNNMFFVVVGDINEKKVIKQITNTYKKIKAENYPPIYIPSEPKQLGKRNIEKRFNTKLTSLSLAWPIPGLNHSDVPALDILSSILGDGLSSRLYKEIRDKKNLAHSISSYAYTPGEGGIFNINASIDPDKKEECEKAILDILENIKENGVKEEELKKAKKSNLSMSFDTLSTVSGQAGELGSNWFYTQNLDFTKHILNKLNNVTNEDIINVTKKYLKNDCLSVSSLIPNNFEKSKKNDKKVAKSKSKNKSNLFTLPNGIRLIVNQNKRLPVVNVSTKLIGSLLVEDENNNGVCSLMANTILKGTKNLTAEEISSKIENVGGEIYTSSGNNTFEVSGECLKTDVDLLLEIIADVIKNPIFPDDKVEVERKSQIATIKRIEDHLLSLASLKAKEKLFEGSSYSLSRYGTIEKVKNIQRKDVLEFYKKYVTGKNLVISIYGDINPQEIKEKVSKHFADLKEGADILPKVKTKDKFEKLSTQEINTEHKKLQSVLIVAYRTPSIYNKNYYAYQILDEACSDMASRFFNRIREKLGLAYYVGSSYFAGPQIGSFSFYLGTSPKQLQLAKKELTDEIKNLAENGLTKEEFQRAKKTYLGKELLSNQSIKNQSEESAISEILGLGFDFDKNVKKEINKLTLKQVNKVAQDLLLNQDHIISIVSPKEVKKISSQKSD